MKVAKILFIFLICYLSSVAQKADKATPYNNIPNVYADTVIAPNGTPMNVMAYLRPDFREKKYPVVWFWNGRGEDTGPMSQLAVWGPFSFISTSWQPNFTVMAVQGLEWANQSQTDSIFVKLQRAYNFGPVIATGLSDGGYGATKLMSYYPTSIAAQQVKALIPMSTAEGFGSTAVAPTVQSKIAVWGFGDDPGDVWGVNTHNFILALQAANPGGPYKWTDMVGDGHGHWNDFYTPTYTEDGLNIYDWALQYTFSGPLALKYVQLAVDASGQLRWIVDDNSNLNHFIIQKSNDGKTFNTIGSTTGYVWVP